MPNLVAAGSGVYEFGYPQFC